MLLTLKQLLSCGASAKGADRYLNALNKYGPKLGLISPIRWACFLAQILHESLRMTRTIENLNYSAEALVRTWPKRFTLEQAKQIERQPQAIANRVYSNRLGNGPEQTGEGWLYRGRGLIMCTGKVNYAEFTAWLKNKVRNYPELFKDCPELQILPDFVKNPERLEEPLFAVLSALWFFEKEGLHELSDIQKFKAQTLAINGGMTGLADRMNLLDRCKKVLM